MPDAPVNVEEGGPTITRVVPFLQFGGEGALAYTTAIQSTRNHPLAAMPDVPGEMLTFVAGAYTTDGANTVTDQGTAALTAGDKIVLGINTNWGEADPFTMEPYVNGAILVVDRPDGGRWATEVLTAIDQTSIYVAEPPPFSGMDLTYHIGNPGTPSSEVVQDGVGSLVGGVTIQPVLGLPEPLEPLEGGALGAERQLRWKPAAGQQPTIHRMYVYDPFNFDILWTFYIDGLRTKVPLPKIPASVTDLPIDTVPTDLFPGGYAWLHSAIYVPNLEYDNWSFYDLGSRSRRAWTTDQHAFIYGGE